MNKKNQNTRPLNARNAFTSLENRVSVPHDNLDSASEVGYST